MGTQVKIKMKKMCICNKEKEIIEMHYKINEVHKYLLGNGQKGMYQEFTEMKGGIKVFKWIAGGGGLLGIITFILSILQILP
jgi:hypothetical protein